jgi:hypothetical protein
MRNVVLSIIVFAIIGLVVGYLIFGRIQGEYIDINLIFANEQGVIESFGRQLTGITTMKQNILISGGVGALVGFLLNYARKK